MRNGVLSRWRVLRIVSLALVVGVGLVRPMSACGQDVSDGSEGADGCSEGTRPYLAAGEWKGTFKLVYEPIVPGMPKGIKTKVTWAGEMSFDVARPEKSDAPPP